MRTVVRTLVIAVVSTIALGGLLKGVVGVGDLIEARKASK